MNDAIAATAAPPDPAGLWDVLVKFLEVVGAAGWPAVVALIVVTGAVIVSAVVAAPRLGAAIAAVRSGTSEREHELDKRVVELESEVHALRGQLEEQSRVFALLLEHLDVDGVDREALARIFTPPPVHPAAA